MHFNECVNFSFSKTRGPVYDSKNLFCNYYDYIVSYQELDDNALKQVIKRQKIR